VLRALFIAACLLALTAVPAAAHGDDDDPTHRDTRDALAPMDLLATVRSVAQAADDEDGGLPGTWCGTERTTDDSVHNAFPVTRPQFKVVYAYPADRPNHFEQWKDALQRDVSLIGRFMGAQSGGLKSPRFDMGTDCGPQYLDIQTVALPAGRAAYVDDFDALTAAVEPYVGSPGGRRNVVVLADTLSSYSPGIWWGLGMRWADDRAGSGNLSNGGDEWAALWIPDGEPVPGTAADGFWPEGMLHEMSHNMGAVQESAPHSSGYGHCWDGFDVMCYYPDGPSPRHVMTYDCPAIPGVMNQGYDCGNDDYFNVAPAAGNYLATHWNLYDDVFMADCADIAPACGGTVTTPPPRPPVSTSAPLVLGSVQVGAQLSLSRGVWTNDPTGYAYQWQRGGGTSWSDIPGASSPTYRVSTADEGFSLRGLVIATNDDGSTVAASGETVAVAVPQTATTAPTAPAATTAAPSPGAAAPVAQTAHTGSGKAKLKVFAGRGRGRALGRIAFALAGGRVTASAPKLRLARGRYDVALCTTAPAGGVQRCAHRRFSARHGRTRPQRLAIGVPAGAGVRATLTLTAVGRPFGARTAITLG
jgi:hypothetical protein